MRVSAGFLVTGLSGYTVIQTLPPRLILRVMAIRAASIWRFVSQPASSALMQYSPNCTFVWPRENPGLRPRCCLRCLTRLGDSMGDHHDVPGTGRDALRGEHLATPSVPAATRTAAL